MQALTAPAGGRESTAAVLPLPAFTDNYIWAIVHGDQAAVVDPGEAGPVLQWLAREGLKLRANRMPFKGYVGTETPSPESATGWQSRVVLAQPEALPFESQSVDLLILPHAFECAAEPHNVLREVERVLVPEGRVVISGFNPWSMWGARTRMPGMEPWLPQPPSSQVSLPRLKDWFKLLSLEVEQSHFGCYAPACRSEKWLQRWGFLESAGARWWSLGGAVYLVSAVKRVAGMRIIGPAWKTKPKRARAASVVVNRQADDGFDRSSRGRPDSL